MSPLVLKIILLVVLILLTLLFGLLPLKILKMLRKRAHSASMLNRISERRWPSVLLCLLSCGTGGVFLATCFLHLLPEAQNHMMKAKYDAHLDNLEYPIAELIACAGFFIVWIVEELVLFLISRSGGKAPGGPHSHSHGHVPDHIHVSLREGVECSGHSGRSASQSPLRGRPSARKVVSPPTTEKNGAALDQQSTDQRSNPSLTALDLNSPTGTEDSCGGSCHQSIELNTGTISGTAEPECCAENMTVSERENQPPAIKMGFKPHAHHHGVRSITLVVALSFHSVIEGLAFGIQSSIESTAALFLSIIFHKCIVAFSVGLQLARTHAHNVKMVVISVMILALMSPIGAAIGMGVEATDTKSKDVILMVFEALSVGTFLYVTFFEVFIHERDNEHNNALKLVATLFGFAIIASIRALGHNHDAAAPHGAHPGNDSHEGVHDHD